VTYVDAGGVHAWYDEHGSGDPLVLLHGGFSDASDARRAGEVVSGSRATDAHERLSCTAS